MSDTEASTALPSDPRSIFNILATRPSGKPGSTLAPNELGKYIAQHYNSEGERERCRHHALRDELYRDRGEQYMCGVIDRMFDDPVVREKRRRWVPYTKISNVARRIAHRLATVYGEPARRFVAGDDENQAKYKSVLDAIQMDEQALQIGRLVNLHRALLVGFRVRKLPDDTREPVLEVVSPANVRAIVHPNDAKLVVAWLVRCEYRTARPGDSTPAWTLWSAIESLQLRDDMTVIADSYQPHDFGVIPYVPVTLGPAVSGFWPGSEGADLVAAHTFAWLQNIFLGKESKSATKLTTISGDGSQMARGQSSDSEVPVELQDGQSVATLDTGMDLQQFRDNTRDVVDQVGLNYELTPALLHGDSVQSAEARDLQMLPLEEIRKQQQLPLRRFEASLVLVIAAVLRVDLPAMGFDPEGFRVEFANSRTPLDPVAEHDLFEKRRGAGLDNTIDFYATLRPGISEDDAKAAVERNIEIETQRNMMMRPLQAISGSLGAAVPSTAPAAPASPPIE